MRYVGRARGPLLDASGGIVATLFTAATARSPARVMSRSLIDRIFSRSLVTIGCGYAAAQSWMFLRRLAAIGQVSMGLAIPMVIPHAALLVGLAGTAVVAALLAAGDVRQLMALHRVDRKGAR